jgi:hypothetical protein
VIDPKVLTACVAMAILPGIAVAAQQTPDGPDTCELLAKQVELKPEPREEPLAPPDCRIDRGCVIVDWRIASQQDLNEALSRFRFTPKKPLKIHTSNVNRLLYTVTWTSAVEPPNKAFETISGLFDKIFPLLGLIPGLPGPAPAVATPPPLDAWVVPLEFADLCLTRTVAANTSLVLDSDPADPTRNRRRLDYVFRVLTAALPKLEERRLTFLKSGSGSQHYDTYWKVAQRHSDFVRRATEFLPLAKESVTGTETTIAVKQRNATVNITGQAAKRSGEIVGPSATARYFVATERPLIYHIGYAQGRIRDFDFETVRTAAGQDLFSWIKPEDKATVEEADGASIEPLAFMSLELRNWGPNARYGLALTIGTGLNTPGESLYYGGTFRIFSRVLISGGLVTARATRGEGPVTEPVAGGGVRDLFGSLATKASTDPFWSVSFKVY